MDAKPLSARAQSLQNGPNTMWLLAPAVLLVPILISTLVSMRASRNAHRRAARRVGPSILSGSLAGLAVAICWAYLRSRAGHPLDRSLWEGVAIGGVLTAGLVSWIVTAVGRAR
ncbi:MAG: hypothetical protein D8M53_05950 [Armatimonadetes bacterium]|nr:hypothetical protein [Armatimonadota bacterium]